MDGAFEERAGAVEGGFGGQAVVAAEVVDFAVFDELVGPAYAEDGGVEFVLVEALEDGGAETAGEDVIFEGDEEFATVGVVGDAGGVYGLGEAGVEDGYAVAFLLEFVS